MNYFFISDLHIHHNNIIKYCNRPFCNKVETDLLQMVDNGSINPSEVRISNESTELMSDTIIDSINATTGKKDHLIIAGDVMFSAKDVFNKKLKELRERIVCENIDVVIGNHDNYSALASVFGNNHVHETMSLNVYGQRIYINHYPHRSWNASHHGCWMLYGHVHNLFTPEDNMQFSPLNRELHRFNFEEVLRKYDVNHETLLNDLIAAAEKCLPVLLTLDIGVDNVRPGRSFGTPWSFGEIRDHMAAKKPEWEERRNFYRNAAKPSTLKVSAEKSKPRF